VGQKQGWRKKKGLPRLKHLSAETAARHRVNVNGSRRFSPGSESRRELRGLPGEGSATGATWQTWYRPQPVLSCRAATGLRTRHRHLFPMSLHKKRSHYKVLSLMSSTPTSSVPTRPPLFFSVPFHIGVHHSFPCWTSPNEEYAFKIIQSWNKLSSKRLQMYF
jgi:hypothetical protein